MSLSKHQIQVARFLGLNEGVLEKLRAGITPKVILDEVNQI